MKFVSNKLCILLVSTTVLFTGCPKKPTRPDPGATAMGQQGGPVAPTNTGASVIPTDGGLPIRTDGFDPNGQDISTLSPYTIFFDYDQSAIKPSEREKLKAAKEHLDKNPGVKLLLEGHCDWRGTAEYNLGLGDRRAASAKKYLVSLGVAADRLETLSKGSLDAKPNASAADMEKDRRVNLILTKAK